ncbi:Na+ dependent nucleoside transporter C-terminus [Geoalkalibacter ferrihydriticus]|uniref:Concentrative nucleoside transporter C-terminal domain-containing protein n=2 Tax=Geoalkalibacter ferrihydriticus TaxID=392333 RepID=A0A0C2HJI0_9BACT|nr:nucleoside transporter C-terminal domain-containing protein [Geoalkalibacter ferrihydriticus]KIH77206.1 hypothetical protein GFER_00045 [Geoalkalibacter ferrihydriticus DSM 17813]SDM25390.1 Na+ dependent nucleoside transporter C-terminus [Geoalkalibacter ferrihydriticus]
MGHILTASLISAPASVVIAKIMVPEIEESTFGALLPDTHTRSGMGAMAPERRHEIVSLGLKSLLAGTLATSMTAAIAALMLPF